jgi:hypothetical protein
MLKRDADLLSHDHTLDPTPDCFLDTCKRIALGNPSGIMTYVDFARNFSQDHLGVEHELAGEIQLAAHTKFISLQHREVRVDFCSDSIENYREASRKDMKFLQMELFKEYKELGRKHRLVSTLKNRKIENLDELSAVLNLCSMYIAKNSKLGGGNFVVVGNNAYTMLLSDPNFIPTLLPSFTKRIEKVGQLSSFAVFLNLDEDDAFVVGRNQSGSSSGTGVYLAEGNKVVSSHVDPVTMKTVFKLISSESLSSFGYYPEHNFFTPSLTW